MIEKELMENEFCVEDVEIESELDHYLGNKQFSDIYNAERFIKEHGENVRYCFQLDKWLLWNGERWQIDHKNKILEYAINTIRSMYLDADNEQDANKRKMLIEWALKSETRRRLSDMLWIAKSLYGVGILPNDLDRDLYVLDCKDGTFDLKSGKLLPFNKDNFNTKFANVTYDTNAECPKWLGFLHLVMNGNKDLINYLQKAIGYSMTGDTSEQCWFLLYGSGLNGKSTFLNTIRMILNNYAMNTPTETFLLKYGDSIPNDVARLKGERFVTTFESSEGKRLNESVIKQMTGGDYITARYLYGEYFDYKPSYKIWFSTNHKPIITGTDYATWRRVRLIPFTVKIPDNKCIRDYHEILFNEESSGIFNWMLDGCALWQLEGLNSPKEVKTATDGYREEMDDIGNFLNEYCQVNKSNLINALNRNEVDKYYLNDNNIYTVKSTKLFQKWCEVTGGGLSQKAFNRKLQERGYFTHRFSGGYEWVGIGLLDEKVHER